MTGLKFNVLEDTLPNDSSLPAFMVSTERGFLPRQEPIVSLPMDFEPLETILRRMPIKTASGEPGLLASGTLGDIVSTELPDLSWAVEKHKSHLPLMNALYRDYSFLASAYLLEPCHHQKLKDGTYGLGRQKLPANIALPITKVAQIAGFKPFMEYAGSYALFNYRLENPSLGLAYDNLRLIRAFEHGLDPHSSEAGFVLVHIAMVKHSGSLVAAACDVLRACETNNRDAFNQAMSDLVHALSSINETMNIMWTKSKPTSYNHFRTFIFGIAKQSMFPNGVIYEGVSEEPMSFRGESGANDSMIPLCDNLLEVSMPDTPLTDILKDFRSYRPGNHREFLESVKECAHTNHVRRFALEEPITASLYLSALNQIRDFRWRHWCFTREYILKNTQHPTATGGSPIVMWLPNQLQAVLDQMTQVSERCNQTRNVNDIMDVVHSQIATLNKEVTKYSRLIDSDQAAAA